MESLPEELIWLIYTYIPRPDFIYEIKKIRILKKIEREIEDYLNIFFGEYYEENIHIELYEKYQELLIKYNSLLYTNYKIYYDLPVFVYKVRYI